MSTKLTGLGKQPGNMKRGGSFLFPDGDYLLRIDKVEKSKSKDGLGMNFIVWSIVEEFDNLPASYENPDDLIGKKFKDNIYIMGPKHPNYKEKNSDGSFQHEIGLNTLASLLKAADIPVKNDAFNEEALPGKLIEVTLSVKRSKKDGKDFTNNQVDQYRPQSVAPVDEVEEDELTETDDDDLGTDDDMGDLGLDDDLDLGDDL